MWAVWRVTYATYAEIEASGLPHEHFCPPVRLTGPLPLERALRMVDELGFGHCVKPCGEGW